MKSMRHSKAGLFVHLVRTTKARMPVLTETFWENVPELARDTLQGMNVVPLATSGIEDHIHLMAA